MMQQSTEPEYILEAKPERITQQLGHSRISNHLLLDQVEAKLDSLLKEVNTLLDTLVDIQSSLVVCQASLGVR